MKHRTIKELIFWCIQYTLYMREHNFNKVELKRLTKKMENYNKQIKEAGQ